MYTPHVGRWLSRDDAGFIDGPNRYLYVKNGPVNGVDPSGLYPAPRAAATPWPATNLNPGQCGPKIATQMLGDLEKTFCCPPRKGCMISRYGENTITQTLPPGVTRSGGDPVGSGLGGGNIRFCGPLLAGTVVGTGGCGPSVCVVVHCADGTTLVGHFNSIHDPIDTFDPYTFPKGCKALICGGNNEPSSNCVMDKLARTLRGKGVSVDISDTESCWVDKNGKHYISNAPGQQSDNTPPLRKSCPPLTPPPYPVPGAPPDHLPRPGERVWPGGYPIGPPAP